MNPLIKKEVRLIFPGWLAAMVLALLQGITRPYDFYPASLLFFGLTLMALTTIGREASLNTFSSLLSQPAERLRLWKIKLSVLSIAFLSVLAVWFAAFGIAFLNSSLSAADRETSYDLFITICLIATATFTGGLWTTLLLRQIAGAFWLTLLVPAVLSGFAAAFFAGSNTNNAVIAVLAVIFAVYSVCGFFFARWLFFRAQDVGWTGGTLVLPEWKWLALFSARESFVRRRKPFFALLKKELQLHQASLIGACGLLVAHVAVLLWREHHQFVRDSIKEDLSSVFWMLWLALPVMVGAMAIAEERKLGVVDAAFCQPVSRRLQFGIKAVVVLFLGVVLGGVLPMFLEGMAAWHHLHVYGALKQHVELPNPVWIIGLAAWVTVASFFGSSLARSFLQAIGCAIAVQFGFILLVPFFSNHRMLFFDSVAHDSILSLLVTVPTILTTFVWLSYLNFKNPRTGWLLVCRHLLVFVVAGLFATTATAGVSHRVWEVFEPAEPAHGLAKLTLQNPPKIYRDPSESILTVRLPDGRVWLDQIGLNHGPFGLVMVFDAFFSPFPKSLGPAKFIPGSDWVSVLARRVIFPVDLDNHSGMELYGIRTDGSLWISDAVDSSKHDDISLMRVGGQNDWSSMSRPFLASMLLVKTNGTLWRWGTNVTEMNAGSAILISLRGFVPRQFGVDSDWAKLSSANILLEKTDGSIWTTWTESKTSQEKMARSADWEHVNLEQIPWEGRDQTPIIHKDGTAWFVERRHNKFTISNQIGTETNWISSARWGVVEAVMLKSDGTLWRWSYVARAITRLGIHNDWVAVAPVSDRVISLAADGSLWLWPSRDIYEYRDLVLKIPKQPLFLGNVLDGAN